MIQLVNFGSGSSQRTFEQLFFFFSFLLFLFFFFSLTSSSTFQFIFLIFPIPPPLTQLQPELKQLLVAEPLPYIGLNLEPNTPNNALTLVFFFFELIACRFDII
jgi:hypothetical protein